MPENERLHVLITPKTSRALGAAREFEGLSKTEFVNRAIQAYAYLLEQKELGAEILVHQSDGSAGRVHFL